MLKRISCTTNLALFFRQRVVDLTCRSNLTWHAVARVCACGARGGRDVSRGVGACSSGLQVAVSHHGRRASMTSCVGTVWSETTTPQGAPETQTRPCTAVQPTNMQEPFKLAYATQPRSSERRASARKRHCPGAADVAA